MFEETLRQAQGEREQKQLQYNPYTSNLFKLKNKKAPVRLHRGFLIFKKYLLDTFYSDNRNWLTMSFFNSLFFTAFVPKNYNLWSAHLFYNASF